MYTAGMPASHSALKQALASLCFSTITAMSRACSGLPSNVAPLASSAPMSAARSAPMWSRSSSIGQVLKPLRPSVARCTTRKPERIVVRRAGEPVTLVVGVDVVDHDRGSPSWAPRSTTCSRSTSAASLRQLVASVFWSPAVSAARRYVTMSPPRNA